MSAESVNESGGDARHAPSRGNAISSRNRPVRTATAVYPVVSFTEKDLARIEAESGVRVRCAAEAAIHAYPQGDTPSELSLLMPVVAEKDATYRGSSGAEDDMPFATGKVARLSRYMRFKRWARKQLGVPVPEAEARDYEDPEAAMRLLHEQEDGLNSKCSKIREAVNGGSAAVVVASMLVLAVLLIVYYFKSYTSFSNTLTGGGGHSKPH